MKENITFVIGDWSKDGHNQTETVTIKSNLTLKEIALAYKIATKKLGFDFTKLAASDYEDNSLDKEYGDILIKNGIDVSDLELDKDINGDEYYLLDFDSYLDTYLSIIKLGNSKFEYEVTSELNILNIGGYGLFS